MKNDTSKDSGYDQALKCSEFEKELCKQILDDLKHQKELLLEEGDDSMPDKIPTNIKELVMYAEEAERGSEKSKLQMLAESCHHFIEKKRFTHYVASIDIGASLNILAESHEKEKTVSGAMEAKLKGILNAMIKGEHSSETITEYKDRYEQGELIIQGETIDVKTEAVINFRLECLSEMVKLPTIATLFKGAMSDVLSRVTRVIDKDNGTGPYAICCGTSDEPIYWMEKDGEIRGTRKYEESATFFVKTSAKKQNSIYIHLVKDVEKIVQRRYVGIKRPFWPRHAEGPLKLNEVGREADCRFDVRGRHRQYELLHFQQCGIRGIYYRS